MTALREARGRLAAQQARLVSALMGKGDSPAGFDGARLRAASLALACKRARGVARAWPGVTQALDQRFGELFAAYSQAANLPQVGGPLADGRQFVHWLAAQGELPEAVRLLALDFDLRFTSRQSGLAPRRWPTGKLAWMRQVRRLIIGIFVPGFGALVISVRLGRS